MCHDVAEQLVDLLTTHRFTYTCEEDLQRGVETVLKENDLPYVREARLSSTDRPDFLVENSIAVELKVKGSPNHVMRQLMRYVHHEKVKAVVLVTTKSSHRSIPMSLGGKPIYIAYLNPL